jgi:hypothetical protein
VAEDEVDPCEPPHSSSITNNHRARQPATFGCCAKVGGSVNDIRRNDDVETRSLIDEFPRPDSISSSENSDLSDREAVPRLGQKEWGDVSNE